MTQVGLLLPLSLYLLLLGQINRRRTPLVVTGVWDGIMLIIGVSGFFLFGGRLILEQVTDRLRLGWLANSDTTTLGPGQVGLILALIYVLLVLCAVAYYFARQRQMTSIYAVDLEQVEDGLQSACEQLSLHPLRSGRLIFFRRPDQTGPDDPATVLEVEPFVAMRHVTLRWDPADAEVRESIEAKLTEYLAGTTAEPGDVCVWFYIAGLFLFALASVSLGMGLAALWS